MAGFVACCPHRDEGAKSQNLSRVVLQVMVFRYNLGEDRIFFATGLAKSEILDDETLKIECIFRRETVSHQYLVDAVYCYQKTYKVALLFEINQA